MPPKSQKPTAAPDAVETPVASDANEDVQRAAQKRKDAVNGRDHTAEYIGALLEERRGYVTRGLDDRVAQVDEQIRARGGIPPTD